MLDVDGKAMRVLALGVEGRAPGQPVIVLEAGAPDPTPGFSPLDTWTLLLPELVRLGPVVAYERRGVGRSAADSEPPTMARVAHVLHDLLRAANIPPPYVLVGHSWGGNYIRAFTDQFPPEVAGLVFIDAETGVGPTREEKPAVVSSGERAAVLAPPALPPIPPNTPPGVRAEFEEIAKEMINDGKEARSFGPLPAVPIAVVVATPPGRMRGTSGAITRLQIQKTLDLVLSAPNGLFVTASHVGHAVHASDPALVASLVQHVLSHPVIP
jgi:pimeloyl-ACP methyl ester carboxylesterase